MPAKILMSNSLLKDFKLVIKEPNKKALASPLVNINEELIKNK